VPLLELVATLQQHASTACTVSSTLKLLSLCEQYYTQVSDSTVKASGLDVVKYVTHQLERFQDVFKHLDDAAALKQWSCTMRYNASIARSQLVQVKHFVHLKPIARQHYLMTIAIIELVVAITMTSYLLHLRYLHIMQYGM
jgi:glycine cleavage system protein P-like pyridoxal-binding family